MEKAVNRLTLIVIAIIDMFSLQDISVTLNREIFHLHL